MARCRIRGRAVPWNVLVLHLAGVSCGETRTLGRRLLYILPTIGRRTVYIAADINPTVPGHEHALCKNCDSESRDASLPLTTMIADFPTPRSIQTWRPSGP
ncbi:hypothetical protein BC628DRAFT_754994 [Trametes gibbosa]|nr:hypothetical protein BC628DRAFT_754994 [Trametes gibbosa]